MLVALLMLAGAVPAPAGGINLAWDQCWREGGTSNKRFGCTTNSGYEFLVGSFLPGVPHLAFIGTEIYVDLYAAQATLPDWWQFFNQGSCRRTALAASADFTLAPQASCVDPWQGLAAGGIAAYQTISTTPPVPDGSPSHARLKAAFALAEPIPLEAQTEYYGFRLSISNAKTLGDSACVGCETDACILLNEIRAVDSDGLVERLTTTEVNSLVTWRCGISPTSGPPPCYSLVGCSVAARNTTWGQLKSLYR